MENQEEINKNISNSSGSNEVKISEISGSNAFGGFNKGMQGNVRDIIKDNNMEVDSELNKNEHNQMDEIHQFQSDGFDDKSFFRLTKESRAYWPWDVTDVKKRVPALTLSEW